MTFEFGIANPSGTLIEDSVKITSVQTVKGVVKPAVVKSGYFTVAQTPGSDYAERVTYLNVWEKATNVHSTSIAEPYTTYTVVRKGGNDMEVEWTTFNNTAQNSVKYKVLLSK
ncbi:MAG: hypothetical protein HC830_03650 [Bacteroidetes bacterium]|nr:hypothetical protein [Bacteroidota bacterium]